MPRAKKFGWYFYNMPLWDLMLHSVPLVLCRDFFPSFNRVAMLFWSGWMIGLLHFLLQCSAAFCQFSQARLTLFSSLSSVSWWYKVLPVSGTLHLQQTFISFTHKDTQGTKKTKTNRSLQIHLSSVISFVSGANSCFDRRRSLLVCLFSLLFM